MLITYQSDRYCTNVMEKFRAKLTPIRRNVARKSTANRPLVNVILRDPLAEFDESDYLNVEKTSSKTIDFTNYPSNETSKLGLYYKDDMENTPKIFRIKENNNSNYVKDTDLKLKDDSKNTLLQQDSEEEDINIDGVFSVSDALIKYLNESLLSPPNYDSSDDSIDLSRVKNFPVKSEKYSKSDEYLESSFSERDTSPSLECKASLGNVKNIKRELLGNYGDDTEIPSVNAAYNVSSEDNSITESGIQTIGCSFDPNLESVTFKVKVREEMMLCENTPIKMTILESAFDLNQLENRVEENGYSTPIDEDENGISFMPKVVCAMSLGNNSTNESIEDVIETVEKEKPKKEPKKTKKISLKNSENVSFGEKRMTRSQAPATVSTKRTTRNSSKLNPESTLNIEDVNKDASSVSSSCDGVDKNDTDKSITNNISNEKSEPNVAVATVVDNSETKAKEEKCESQKKCGLEKKGKKDINEGVLLHVEATKETELMRDGKIIKDKEEYLKDIESKIDKNLPVVVEKEFDIQQSLTEEILLDQALRLAHQRTSPRLSKFMKEAVIKASAPKQSTKSKLPKNNNNKSNSKGNKSLTSEKSTVKELETIDSTTNNSMTSGSTSDVSSNLENSQDIDILTTPNEIQTRKKKDNYVVAPIPKQSNDEKLVEPLTIKILRKNNKKKTGFKLSPKKKKSPKKKGNIKSKLVHSTDVNMDDLSRTFEDILQDDNWCSNEKGTDFDCSRTAGVKEKVLTPPDSVVPENSINLENSSNIRKDTSLKENNETDEVSSESCQSNKPTKNKMKKQKLLTSTKEIEVSKSLKPRNSLSENSGINCEEERISVESSISNKDLSIPEGDKTESPLLNKHVSPEKELSTMSSEINEVKSDINENSEVAIDTPPRPASANCIDHDSIATDNSVTSSISNKVPTSQVHDTSQNLSNSWSANPVSSPTKNLNVPSTSLTSHIQSQTSINESPLKNNHSMNEKAHFFNANRVEAQNQNVLHQPIISVSSNLNSLINDNYINPFPENTLQKLNCPINTPVIDTPKVLPLSIASRDPRLRKSHVRVIVEVNTSSVSNSIIEKPHVHQETRIISHVIENFSKEVDNSKILESDTEVNDNQLEIERKKKLKKKEIDSELLYKTPLSDLHDVPERSSYARSIRKKSPPKKEKRERRPWNDSPISHTPQQSSETYHEYHQINMVYSKVSHHDPTRIEMINNDPFKRNVFDDKKIERYRTDSQPSPSDRYSTYRNDEFSSDSRRRENHVKNFSSEYAHEVRHSEERSYSYHNHSDHRRSNHHPKEFDQDYRRSENYPPDYVASKNYSRGYKRSNDFSVDHNRHESPDYKEKEPVRERNTISHNEPSYSRWDYSHVKGRLPAEVPQHRAPKEEDSPPNNRHLWEEERDLIDGPVKNVIRPYYRRKKFSREELFDRRTDNRRYAGDNERNYERLWVRKTDQELIHGPDRWDRRSRKVFRDSRDDRSRSPRRDHDRYGVRHSRSPVPYFKSRRDSSHSPHRSPVVLESPMSPEPAERYCVLEPTKCLTVPQ